MSNFNISEPYREEAFNFKLELLKIELDSIQKVIEKLDGFTVLTRYWAILVWGGSIALILGSSYKELRAFLSLTAILPLCFWAIDAWWRHIQRTCIFRSNKISDFVNGKNFLKSFEKKEFIDFELLDIRAKKWKKSEEYKKYSSFWKTVKFPEVLFFYGGLSLISLIFGILLN